MLRAGLLFVALVLAAPVFGTSMSAHLAPLPDSAQGDVTPLPPSGKLTEPGRLAIVRDVDGEFAKAVRPLPSIKSGFLLKPGQKINQEALNTALIESLPAANPGDKVQITGVKFERKRILVNINGGSNPHKSWRDRIQLSVGMPFPTAQSTQIQPPGVQRIGSTLILDFGQDVPNLSPAQVKQFLSPFLNFSGQSSAAQDWIDTVAPQFRQAIAQRKAVVGMDKQMVIAALGQAGRKVRNFPPDGPETEDWIYGNPPGTTIFVTFLGDKVIRVKQFP